MMDFDEKKATKIVDLYIQTQLERSGGRGLISVRYVRNTISDKLEISKSRKLTRFVDEHLQHDSRLKYYGSGNARGSGEVQNRIYKLLGVGK